MSEPVVTPSFRERFEQSHAPQDYLNWLNDYTNTKGRGDDELHALCSWAYSVIQRDGSDEA